MRGEAEARRPQLAADHRARPSTPELLRHLSGDASLPDILDRLVRELERVVPGTIASVLLVENGRLRLGAAPNLPEAYNRAADNHPIGEGYGSCGTAAHRRELVIAEDLQADPLWKNYREITRRYQLGACWSMPIYAADRAVLGTFALYTREPRRPDFHELRLMREFSAVAAVAIERHRRETALADSQERFRELIDSLQAIVWEGQGRERVFTHVSRHAERLLGYPARRWREDPGLWASLIHPEDREVTLRHEREAADRGQSYEAEYRLTAADGRSVWVRDTVEPGPDRGPAARRRRGVIVDITRQRQAEQEREEAFQRLRQGVPAAAPSAVPPPAPPVDERLLIDAGTSLGESLEPGVIARNLATLATRHLADWSLVYVRGDDGQLRCAALAHREPDRPGARAEFDRLIEQPGGLPFRVGDLIEGGRSQLFAELPDDAFPPGAVRSEVLALVRSLGAGSAVAVPLPAPTRVFGALVCVSASPLRLGERELALAEELGRRAALALDNARLFREARVAVQRREEFLSIAAHELKTPVASLLLTVQTIQLGLDQQPLDMEFVRGRAAAGERQGARLGRLINELLDVSRIRAGRLVLTRADMDLAATLQLVVGRFRDEIKRKGVDVTVHAPDPVPGHWDPSLIEQILSNLLSNALKYGNRKPVHVGIEQQGDRVALEVTDQGIGMDPSFLPRLFNPFERGVSAGHYGGLGLGLYIADQNARAHGGEITVRSQPGHGSTFRVQLPRHG